MQKAEKREKCYAARDAYFKCLDALPEDPTASCAGSKKELDGQCPASWVSYFIKQHEREVVLQYQVDASKGVRV